MARPATESSPIGSISDCVESDVPAVVDLHRRIWGSGDHDDGAELRAYYRGVFFENPWPDPGRPPLVYRNDDGRLTGFMGVVNRTMLLDGTEVHVSVPHRLMVVPESDSSIAGVKLLKELFNGPQDLTLTDGANDEGRIAQEAAGASTCWLYSTNWIRPLRPSAFGLRLAARRHAAFGAIARLASPFTWLADRTVAAPGRGPLGFDPPTESVAPISAADLVECVERFSRPYRLRPSYDEAGVRWLLDFLSAGGPRGELKGAVVTDARGRAVGAFLYLLDASGIGEVLFLTGSARKRDVVLRHLFQHAIAEGAVGLGGRVEPRFLPELWNLRGVMKSGDWTLLHSRHPDIAAVIHAGDAFLTALDGELWMHGPSHHS